ncbi:ATP-binding protein [Candidatus Phytoplasma melaleucae]|uniref:ATP-binding protein n=1 Tax=Candidatus Phytoplasma melaleucae TaxID=2982630 RepID=A0ABT9DDZ4_9MOLU|nr:ATP-binding protein ['Melaleuca sp.' phytoplasma]MDO8167902.1 ATP-binding protein ['Melaleuca sp.' phytoplasma]MDV3205191.1 ATP-binding protein [Weeping tea tree witches'-broom phytoplasma]
MSISKEKYFQKMKNDISKHPETKNLIIDDKDVIMVYNYLQNKDKENPFGYKLILKHNPYVHVIWQETQKTKQINLQNNLASKNILFNQALEFNLIEIEKFTPQNKIQTQVFKQIQIIVQTWNKTNKGFYLYGPFNTGKTFILKIFSKILMQNNIPFLFIFMPDLARQLKTIWSNDILENKLNYLKTISCLLLDDLGSENMTPFFRDDILLPLLYYRYEHQLPVFFSSNLDFTELLNFLQFNQDINSKIKANKIINLIKKTTLFYNFADLEKKKSKSIV